jgi:phenylacetate-coenzyme A ligase PaaK-like adenylate-forming protein
MHAEPWRQIGRLSKEDLARLQNRKLRSFISNYLYPFSPRYKKLFDDHKIDPGSICSVDDLRRVPFTTKKDLTAGGGDPEVYKSFILQPTKEKIRKHWPLWRQVPLGLKSVFRGARSTEFDFQKEFRPVFTTFTTGTTSMPVPFVYSNHDIARMYTSGARMMDLFKVAFDEKVINLFPFAPHLAFWQVVFGGFAACRLVLSTGGGKVLGTEGNIRAIMKMRPVMILGVPGYVYHLLREAREQNCRMPFLKKVVLGAARCTTAFKIRLAELLESMGARDVSVFGTYGFTEARCAWAECPTPVDQSSGYFLYPDKEIFEIIDPETGEPRGEGQDGELVYTGLDARGSCVLRYRTGDFVKGGITREPCPHTGMTVPRISCDIVRLSDSKDLRLSKVKGALVDFSHFPPIFSEIEGVEEWQVELRKVNDDPYEMDEFLVYVSARGQAGEEELKARIADKIQLVMEIRPTAVRVVPLAEMVRRLGLETENKEKRILDNRPKN